MGMRLRLKSSYDISSFSTNVQVILTAMKKYGLIMADNGSAMYISGAPDSRWDNNDLHNLSQVPASAFEVVEMNPVYTQANVPQGAAPAISSFKASASPVPAGTSVTLSWSCERRFVPDHFTGIGSGSRNQCQFHSEPKLNLHPVRHQPVRPDDRDGHRERAIAAEWLILPPCFARRMPLPTSSRLAYIDWMRGLACVLMFQTHCYDAWLGGNARNSKFFMWSQLGGTLPAPLFLFLLGVSFALVVDKLRQKRSSRRPNCTHHDSPRRGDLRSGPAVPAAGIYVGLGMGFVDRRVPCGHPQYRWEFR